MEYRISQKVKKIRSIEDLDAWKQARELVVLIYSQTKSFPREEQFGLISQMNRSAVSVPSNIAEGFGRSSYKEKSRFYIIARGSLIELQNQVYIAKDVGYMSSVRGQEMQQKIDRVHKVLNGLITSTKFYS